MAYNEHQKSDEEVNYSLQSLVPSADQVNCLQKKAHTWALSNWAQDADQRTKQFYREGPRGPATWILNQGKTMPKDAIVVSQEGDWTFYVCRAFHEVCHCLIHLGTELTLYGSREVSVSVVLEAHQNKTYIV